MIFSDSGICWSGFKYSLWGFSITSTVVAVMVRQFSSQNQIKARAGAKSEVTVCRKISRLGPFSALIKRPVE